MPTDSSNRDPENAGRTHPRGRYLDLFLISFLILFFELACIRWFASTVRYLTFFTNLVLLACFLGMSVGLMSAKRGADFVRAVFPIALVAVTLAVAAASTRVGRMYQIDVGGQESPQQVFFGTEFYQAPDPSQFIVPIEAVAGLFFVLIALVFVGLGQVMGRAFDAIANPVLAYTADIVGSLAGIASFSVMSFFRTPPELWFTLVAIVGLRFLPKLTRFQAASALALLGMIGFWSYREGTTKVGIWSPYYKINYNPKEGWITTNNIGHQAMVKVGETGAAYYLPHLLNRDAGNGPFGEVMIVGAGSGNDVSAALANGVKHVDAVEIDPVLNEIGRFDHPNKPFDDSRVSITLDDGRSALRRSSKQYDLIAYALVDSLVLHSGYSSLRLESFLFTEQAFRDVKARLGDDGLFVMSNYYRQGWIVGRLVKMAEQVFEANPIVLSLPYGSSIKASDTLKYGYFNIILVGKKGSKTLESIRKKFEADQFFWLNRRPLDNLPLNGFAPEPRDLPKATADAWQKIGPATVETTGIGPLPTDDWPFLYLRDTEIPRLNLKWMGLATVLSLVILFAFAPVRSMRPSPQMFFLGAGFMLLETKGVVHLALLFGSTWVVNSLVFFAILVMILLSNLFVLALKPTKLVPYYLLLIAALLVNAFVPMDVFLDLPGVSKVVASCAVVFIPVFFAGVIFASAFAKSRQPDIDFGSNVAGVILGGLSENASLILGFDKLLLLAVAFYVLSALFGPRRTSMG
jgi:Spermine/spermidine synthase domain